MGARTRSGTGRWPWSGALVVLAVAGIWTDGAARAEPLRPYTAVGDAISERLAQGPGDPRRGREVVVNRNLGNCLLCHVVPIPAERFHGNLGPSLAGVGRRLSEGQLRLRVVDSMRVNPGTIMPAYHRVDGLNRVQPAYRGRPVLTGQEVEDVVAYLLTLRE